MRRTVIILALLCSAFAAAAQEPAEEPAAEKPDYSKDTLVRLFSDVAERDEVERRIDYGFGYIDFRALGMRWRVGYLPILQPLQGSQPWRNQDRWPDPFALTRTEIASPPRTWRQSREMSAELRRIERRIKKSTSVVVKPD
jgi:hypothetical protein